MNRASRFSSRQPPQVLLGGGDLGVVRLVGPVAVVVLRQALLAAVAGGRVVDVHDRHDRDLALLAQAPGPRIVAGQPLGQRRGRPNCAPIPRRAAGPESRCPAACRRAGHRPSAAARGRAGRHCCGTARRPRRRGTPWRATATSLAESLRRERRPPSEPQRVALALDRVAHRAVASRPGSLCRHCLPSVRNAGPLRLATSRPPAACRGSCPDRRAARR